MDKWFKDILPDKDPYHNRGRDQMRKKGVRTSSACASRCTTCNFIVKDTGTRRLDPPLFSHKVELHVFKGKK